MKEYIARFKNSFKRNGLFKTLSILPKKLSVLLRDLTPNKRRKLIENIINEYAKIVPWHYEFIGGYAIKSLSLDQSKKVALCFGIYDGVTNELALSENGFKVYAFDPTPISQNLFKQSPIYNESIEYYPWAVWSEDKEMKFFYISDTSDKNNFEGTFEMSHGDKFEKVDAFSLNTIIQKFNIDYVDYIKMDIEGAVPEVLNAYFESETNIEKFPYEMSFELEIPIDIASKKSIESLEKIYTLLETLKDYYNIYYIPDDKMIGNIALHATRFDKDS